MCKVMNRQKEGWLRVKNIENFPCQDLRTIDQLWVKYSNGHFGFSVQKEIRVKCVSWEQFCMAVGWATKGLESKLGMDFSKQSLSFCRHKLYGELTFLIEAPKGHLPSKEWNGFHSTYSTLYSFLRWVVYSFVSWVVYIRSGGMESRLSSLFSRVETCQE